MSERVLSQDFDFLGSLRERLAGLTGFVTMALELAQNAEDAAASTLSFDFKQDKLVVANNSEFTNCQNLEARLCPKIKKKDGKIVDCDFHRMRCLAGGQKREEEDTIGTFGIGFVSVYQFTDHPQIITSGKEWTFRPEEDSSKRILERDIPLTAGRTKFILPWAFDPSSEVRQRLALSGIQQNQIMEFQEELFKILPHVLIFLKNLNYIEMRNNGEKILTVRREGDRDSGEVLIAVDDRPHFWKIFNANFKRPESSHIERKKKTEVFIAVPHESSGYEGLLFTFLPTQISTGFPFHINADFYPTPERKGIILDGTDYRVEWNKRALEKAAELLLESLVGIRDIFGHKTLFACLKAAKEKEKHPDFNCFWSVIKNKAKGLPVVFTSWNKWEKAENVFLPRDEEEDYCRPILEDLGFSFAHSDLRPYWTILTELGAQNFEAEDLIEALKSVPLYPGTPLTDTNSPLNSEQNLRAIYEEFDRLFDRIRDVKRKEKIKENIAHLRVGLSIHDKVYPLDMLRRASKEDQEIFKFLGEKVLFANELNSPDAFLVKTIPTFSVVDALRLVKGMSGDDFLESYSNGSWDPLKVNHFFAIYSKDFQQSSQLREQFLDIPMFMAREEFRPLRCLSFPGQFKDPLKLDILIQEKLDGMVTDFLRVLGVKELDLATYAKLHIPDALQKTGVDSEQRRILVDELSKSLSLIRDDQEAIRALCDCSIVECEDGEFRKGFEVYIEGPKVRAVLGGGGYHKVSYPKDPIPESYKEFYCTIGVSESPRPRDIINRIREIVKNHPMPETRQKIEEIFYFLSESWERLEEDQKKDFIELRNLEWLPEDGNTEYWRRPCDLYTRARAHLFQTQGRFLEFKKSPREYFQNYLGLKVEPSVEQVVQHLLICSENNIPAHRDIYRFLSDKSRDSSIRRLIGKKCINIGDGNFVEPSKLFWQEHPFGTYRYRLDADLRPFNEFFKVVGVKETPGLDDYIAVLLEISDQFGTMNKSIDDQTHIILHRCFAHLQQRMVSGEIKDEDFAIHLRGRKIVPQASLVLYPPEWVFFEDKSGIAEKFDGRLARNVIGKDRETWQVLEKLGVRSLSLAVKATIHHCEGEVYDPSLTIQIKERRKSIDRIVESRKKQIPDGWQSEMLEGLDVYKVRGLEVVYSLGALKMESSPVSERVFLDGPNRRLYVNYGMISPYRDIARELALALNPTVDLSDLGPVINEILQSVSPEEAERILDEYRFDKVVTFEPGEVESEKLVTTLGKEEEEIEKLLTKVEREASETKPEVETKGEGRDISVKVPPDLGEKDKREEKKEKPGRRARLRSYVLSPEQAKKRESEESNILSEEEKQAINEAGMKRAIQYEKDEKRHPKQMPHFHEGYDIESYNDEETVERYIEVKSTKSKWGGFEVELTRPQFEKARELGERYFLYVIDNALSENPGFYVIQNPALRASGYLYDRPWADSDAADGRKITA